MAYILDGVVILILLASILSGKKRGFIKTITGLVALLAAMAVAWLLSTPAAALAYRVGVQPTVQATAEEYIGASSPAAENIDAALQNMPTFLRNLLANSGITSGAAAMDRLAGAEEGLTAVEAFTTRIVEPMVMPLLKTACMILLFVIALVAAHILLGIANVVAKLPLLKQLNNSLGAVAGAVTGLLWVLLAVAVMQVLAATNTLITQEILDGTLLINWIIALNPVGSVLQQAMAMHK